jgi:hypothetical protein
MTKFFIQQVSLDEQIQEVQREIALRKRVYPRWIQEGKIQKEKADLQILTMEAVLWTLNEKAKETKPQQDLFGE